MGAASWWRSSDGEVAYWGPIKARLQGLSKSALIIPTRLILVGDSVSDKTFLNVLRDALMELSIPSIEDETVSSHLGHAIDDVLVLENTGDPLFKTAMGAAEPAKRSMESPAGCLEGPSCYDKRGEKWDIV